MKTNLKNTLKIYTTELDLSKSKLESPDDFDDFQFQSASKRKLIKLLLKSFIKENIVIDITGKTIHISWSEGRWVNIHHFYHIKEIYK